MAWQTMNERIEQLLEQARAECFWFGSKPATTVGYDELEKFAELIVGECLDIASEIKGEPASDTHFVIGYHRACEKMIDAIKEHFGVDG